MSVTNVALYRLLVKGGASEAEAEAAAAWEASELATKADLREAEARLQVGLHELKASLLMWMIGIVLTAMGIQTAIVVGVLLQLARR